MTTTAKNAIRNLTAGNAALTFSHVTDDGDGSATAVCSDFGAYKIGADGRISYVSDGGPDGRIYGPRPGDRAYDCLC